jgi:hypothetical protein
MNVIAVRERRAQSEHGDDDSGLLSLHKRIAARVKRGR